MIAIFLTHRIINLGKAKNSEKYSFFGKYLSFSAYINRQILYMWCQNGYLMSLENRSFFQLLKKVTFRRIPAFRLHNMKLSFALKYLKNCYFSGNRNS
jgi:hypothetical protein